MQEVVRWELGVGMPEGPGWWAVGARGMGGSAKKILFRVVWRRGQGWKMTRYS